MVVASRSCSRRRLPRPRDLLRTLAPGLPVGFQDDDAQPRRQAALRSGTSAVRSGETRPSQIHQACRRRREREADLLLQLLSSGGSDHTAEDDGLPLHAEYAYTLHVTEKSDVFSFGVVILELVTGKSPITPEIGEKDLVAWVCDNIDQNSVESVLDHKIVEQFKNEMRKVLNIGLLCVNKSPEDRPPMRSVVKMLLEVEGENKP